MPDYGFSHGYIRRRTAEGRKLDKLYKEHKIGFTYYNKICNKRIYWEWVKVDRRKYLC